MRISDLARFAALNFSRGNIGTAGCSGDSFKYIGPGEFIACGADTGDTTVVLVRATATAIRRGFSLPARNKSHH